MQQQRVQQQRRRRLQWQVQQEQKQKQEQNMRARYHRCRPCLRGGARVVLWRAAASTSAPFSARQARPLHRQTYFLLVNSSMT